MQKTRKRAGRETAYADRAAELVERIAEAAVAGNHAVVTAESCTAGSVARALALRPGASAWLQGGFVTYTEGMKEVVLGVRDETIRRYGVVSEPVAQAMAAGALGRCAGADLAVSVTGLAGPAGDGVNPVGTVALGWAKREAGHIVTYSRTLHIPGERAFVMQAAVTAALSGLLALLYGEHPAEAPSEFAEGE